MDGYQVPEGEFRGDGGALPAGNVSGDVYRLGDKSPKTPKKRPLWQRGGRFRMPKFPEKLQKIPKKL